MAITIKNINEGQLNNSSGTPTVVVPAVAAGKSVLVKSISLVNTDTNTITVNIFFTKSGGSGAKYIAPKALAIPAGSQLVLDNEVTMGASDTITGYASTASKIDFVVNGLERDV